MSGRLGAHPVVPRCLASRSYMSAGKTARTVWWSPSPRIFIRCWWNRFLKDTEYSFPVVHGKEIAEKFFPVVYFPQNWIIDPQGRRLDIPAPRASEATIPRIEELADKV